jgi:Flp pilus assembly secretin CpaC
MMCMGVRITPSARYWLLALLVSMAFTAPAIAREAIAVKIDQATVLKLPECAATVIVGNPLIADFTIQPGGLAVITGKGYGATNVIVMDHSGAVMMKMSWRCWGRMSRSLWFIGV